MLTKEKPRSNRLKDLMINDNGFAFDPRSGITYNLSATGMEVVGWLKQGLDGDAIVQRLTDKYEVADDTARGDLQSFLSTLRKYALIDDSQSKTR
jgi:PqqD family protein of HPr-rel-A system